MQKTFYSAVLPGIKISTVHTLQKFKLTITFQLYESTDIL